MLFNVTILPAQEYLQSEPSVQQLGRASQASPLPQVQQAPHRPQEHCNLHTRRDLDWVLRLGWVRGVTPLRYRSDTPGCRQLYQCPVLRHRRLLFQTPSLPFQGLKAAAIAGAGAQVSGVLRGGGVSSGKQKRTHPKEAVTQTKASSSGTQLHCLVRLHLQNTNSNKKIRTSSQESQDIEPQLKALVTSP